MSSKEDGAGCGTDTERTRRRTGRDLRGVVIERTLRKKLPRALPAWRRYRKLLELEIVPLPEWKEIERHRGTIADKDVPVIVSAIQGKCDLLVTGDRKDFGALARKSSLPFRIVTPAECVTQLGIWMEALGD